MKKRSAWFVLRECRQVLALLPLSYRSNLRGFCREFPPFPCNCSIWSRGAPHPLRLAACEFKMSDSQPGATAPSPSPSNGKEKPDTGFVSGDDTWTQFKNIYSILTGKMSPDGIEQFRLARDIRNEEADCKRCDEQKEFLLQYSMLFHLLRTHI